MIGGQTVRQGRVCVSDCLYTKMCIAEEWWCAILAVTVLPHTFSSIGRHLCCRTSVLNNCSYMCRSKVWMNTRQIWVKSHCVVSYIYLNGALLIHWFFKHYSYTQVGQICGFGGGLFIWYLNMSWTILAWNVSCGFRSFNWHDNWLEIRPNTVILHRQLFTDPCLQCCGYLWYFKNPFFPNSSIPPANPHPPKKKKSSRYLLPCFPNLVLYFVCIFYIIMPYDFHCLRSCWDLSKQD